MSKVRAFIAIPLPDSILKQLGRIQRKLEPDVPPGSVRWTRPQSIHLTLKFLGDTPTDKIPEIATALDVVARHAPPCTLTVEKLGCFPNMRRPRVLWVGITEPTGRLEALQAAIEEAMEPLGYQPERRDFTPHLTLGRVRRKTERRDVYRIGDLVTQTEIGSLGQIEANRFDLIQSVLKPTGAEYTTLEQFDLRQ